MSERRDRLVTAVVVDPSGQLLGAMRPRSVALPWWQETGPIVDAIPGATVLRLLDAEPDPVGPMGGSVTYLVELEDAGQLDLVPWTGTLDDHPLRHPWARPGGPAADHRWVAERVTITGQPRQYRTWNLSAIWSYPTTAGTVWLKCVPPFFAHEADVIGLLAGEDGPELLAAGQHRLLLADMGGRDGSEASDDEQRAMLDALTGLQRRATDRVDELVAAGVPDLRSPVLGPTLAALVERLVPTDDPRHGALRALVDELPERLALADAAGPPPTLVHGDAHGGNCRLGLDRPLWFDWGDSFVGSSLLDLACDWDKSPSLWRWWLARWDEDSVDAAAAWDAIAPVAALRQAWVYQRFCDHIEPAERIYHGADVPAALDAAITRLGDR